MHEKIGNLDFDPHNLPDGYLEAIGLACACYAQTEDTIQMAISGLLGIDAETGWAVTAHMSFPLRESVIKALSDTLMTDLTAIETLDSILDDLKKASSKRNDLVHYMWCTDRATREVFRIETRARTRVSVDQKPVTLEEIRQDAKFIYTAGLKLLDFLLSKNLLPQLPPRNRIRFDKRKALRNQKTK